MDTNTDWFYWFNLLWNLFKQVEEYEYDGSDATYTTKSIAVYDFTLLSSKH